jgi:hypothetical protein
MVHSQADSVQAVRDSLQDARMDRMERLDNRTEKHLYQLDGEQLLQDQTIDSLATELDRVREELKLLAMDREHQAEQLEILGEELEQTIETSRINHSRLRNSLWISGTVAFLLLLASFLILFVYGHNTRQLLGRLRKRQNRLRKMVTQDMERQEEVFMDALSSQHIRIRTEMKQQRKELKAEIRKQKKAWKSISDSLKRLKIKKRKKN